MSSWYYANNQEQIGPVSEEDIINHIRTGAINRKTLVWHATLDDWTYVHDIPTFKLYFEQLPPPLPRFRASLESGEITAETPSASTTTTTLPQIDSSALAPRLAGPWPRFFARVIDSSIVSAILGFAIAFAALFLAPDFYLWILQVDTRIYSLMILPLTAVTMAVIMTVFGTSLGKALFGIRVIKLSPASNTFMFQLKRELSVWIKGLALGIPIFALFTEIYQYRRVSAHQPASYDIGKARVEGKPLSLTRKFVAATFFIIVLGSIVVLNVLEKEDQSKISRYQSWQNPITLKQASISQTWTATEIPSKAGKLYHFDSTILLAEVLFGFEPLPRDDFSNNVYANALAEALSDTLILYSEWKPLNIAGRSSLRASARLKSDNSTDVQITVFVVGQNAWRTLVFTKGRKVSDVPLAEDLAKALAATSN